MNSKSLLMVGLVLAILIAAPGVSLAKDGYSGSVTVGVERTDQDKPSFKSGEYDGVDDDSTHFLGAAEVTYEKESYYMDFVAEEVGHDSRSLGVESGRYGTYRFYIEYDQLPHLVNDTGVTPFLGAGSGNLTLPAFFNATALTTNMNLTNLNRVDLETERKTLTVGYGRALREGLDFSIQFKREEKEGIKEISGVVGYHGGNGRSAIMPEPVDYKTDELRVSFEYNTEKGSARLEYFLSRFENKVPTLTWENIYGTVIGGGPPYQTGANSLISLPPDNEHQKLSLSGAYNLTDVTRLSMIAELGRMEQDEDLLPYSTNFYATALPRANAQAEIETTHFGLNLTSRPRPKLNVTAKYRYYETKNKTPVDLFQYVKNDNAAAAGLQPAIAEETAVYNSPYDYKQQQLKLDGNYRLAKTTTVKLGVEREEIDRSHREVEKTEENTYRAGVKVRVPQALTLNINAMHARREADGGYDVLRVYEEHHTSGYLAGVSNPLEYFDNHPDMRKYDIADRQRDRVGINMTVFAGPETTVGLYLNRTEDDYDRSLFGLQESDNDSYTVDMTRSLSRHASLYAFYTNEQSEMLQASRDYEGGAPGTKAAQAWDATRDWTANHDDKNDTLGVGATLSFLSDDLTVDANYSYSSAVTDISFTAGSALPVPIDLPQLQTRLNTLDVTGRYRFDKQLTLGVGYNYERYRADNWSTDGFDPGTATIPLVLTMTGGVPDYDAHLFRLFASYDF